MRLTELAAAAQVTKQTAAFLVDQLERAGYVVRRPDPTDARRQTGLIAERGRRAQQAARDVEQAGRGRVEAHLGADRMAALRSRCWTCGRSPTLGPDPWGGPASLGRDR